VVAAAVVIFVAIAAVENVDILMDPFNRLVLAYWNKIFLYKYD